VGTGTTGGTLNQFTSGLADAVNGILTAGRVSTAAGAASGLPLFSYDSSGATSAAASIRINPSITADQLAAADAAGNVNASANQLAALADPTNVQGQIGGIGLTGFFAGIAASAGQENQSAQSNQTVQESVTAQAKSLRDHISGVSLDSQASALLEFQRAYQAVARVLTVINGLADSALGIIPHA
jgi:flagellar hook-associated protein 1 FlgK